MIKYKTYTVIIGSSVEYIPTSQLNTIANNIVDCKLKTDPYYDSNKPFYFMTFSTSFGNVNGAKEAHFIHEVKVKKEVK